jgi:hypothetical protein
MAIFSRPDSDIPDDVDNKIDDMDYAKTGETYNLFNLTTVILDMTIGVSFMKRLLLFVEQVIKSTKSN